MKQYTNQTLIEIEDEYEYQGPYTYDEPFDLDDKDQFPYLPGFHRLKKSLSKSYSNNMNYKKALLKGLAKSPSMKKKLSVRVKKFTHGLKDLGLDIKHGARSLFRKRSVAKDESAGLDELDDIELAPEEDEIHEVKQSRKSVRSLFVKTKSKEEESPKEEEVEEEEDKNESEKPVEEKKGKGKEKEKGFAHEIRAFFARIKSGFENKEETASDDEKEKSDEEKKKVQRTKSKEHKSKALPRRKSKGKGKEEQRQSPREDDVASDENPHVSSPFNVASNFDRSNDEPKTEVIS